MAQSKINPALWYHTKDGKVNHVTDYYKSIFGSDFEPGQAIPLGETPDGYAEMCYVKLFGQEYLMMTTAIEHHKFNDTFAIMLNCEDQAEIDKFWNYFTKEGAESMCGWCMDKFGLRWQVIPKNMGALIGRPHGYDVLMKQKKIIIAEYFK